MEKIKITEGELKSLIKKVVVRELNESSQNNKKSKQKKFDKVMGEFGDGTLKTPNGDVVTDRKQAIAIAYSESGLDESKQKLYNLVENVVRKVMLEKINTTLNEGSDSLKHYTLKVKHDNGKVNLKTTASSEKEAKEKIMKAEGCPESAIISCKETGSVIKEGRPFQLGRDYTHFAIDKVTGKIINGYDYKGYDAEDLKSDVRYYFLDDLADYFDFYEPKRSRKDVKIITRKKLEAAGVNIKDTNNWLKSSDSTPENII